MNPWIPVGAIPRRIVRITKNSKYQPHVDRVGQICRVDYAGKDWLRLSMLTCPMGAAIADMDGVEDMLFEELTEAQKKNYFTHRP